MFSIFAGDRPYGIGSVRKGELDIGVGRRNKFDDDKGLPDGVQDKDPISANFAFGLFETKEVVSERYKFILDNINNAPIIVSINETY